MTSENCKSLVLQDKCNIEIFFVPFVHSCLIIPICPTIKRKYCIMTISNLPFTGSSERLLKIFQSGFSL